MTGQCDLHVLFPTSFSDSCFQAGRALAQLADRCRLSLTILHVARPGSVTADLRRMLDSFLGEADHYDHCRRVLVEASNVPAAVAEYATREAFDMIMAPSSDRLGLHRALLPSFRARLLKYGPVPLWSIGPSFDPARFRRGIRNIAWLVDFDHDPSSRLPLIERFAAQFGARVHLFDVLAPIGEETVTTAFDSDRPLVPAVSRERLGALADGQRDIRVDVGVGTRGRELRRMLERSEADLLFVVRQQAERGLVVPHFARDLDALPCPVVCLSGDPQSFAEWSFDLSGAARHVPMFGRELVAAS